MLQTAGILALFKLLKIVRENGVKMPVIKLCSYVLGVTTATLSSVSMPVMKANHDTKQTQCSLISGDYI